MQQFSPETRTSAAGDIAACRALLRDGSRTFYAASFLLPRHVREPASALYAFCRLADDSVDVDGGSLEAIRQLSDRLDCAYAGRPLHHPADRAFAATVARFDMPRALPEALLAGLQWDAEGRRYETLADLNAYAARVAGTVGAMMAVLMGVRSAELAARACDLGVAMQLTNIARDVGEDARAGRLYLPLDWMRDAGIDPDEWLAAPGYTNRLGSVIARLLDAADTLYERADTGIARLPASCRPGIRAARLLYAEIGHEVRRRGGDSVSTRAVVPNRRKLALIGQAVAAPNSRRRGPAEPCLEQTSFLVEAIATMRPSLAHPRLPRWWNLHGQAVRVIDLFESLERRERQQFASRKPDQITA